MNMKIENFKTATFEQDVLQSSAPVLIDFWAPWCTHCRVLNPMLEVFARENGQIRIGKVNIDEEQDLAKKFGIMSIPTVLYIKDGAVKEKKVAPQELEDLEDMIS